LRVHAQLFARGRCAVHPGFPQPRVLIACPDHRAARGSARSARSRRRSLLHVAERPSCRKWPGRRGRGSGRRNPRIARIRRAGLARDLCGVAPARTQSSRGVRLSVWTAYRTSGTYRPRSFADLSSGHALAFTALPPLARCGPRGQALSLMVRKSVVRGATVGLAALFLAACSAGAVSPNDNDGVESRPVPAIRYTPEPTAAPTNAATLAPKPTATAAPDWSEVPAAANDATGVAQQLVMVEAMLRDPGVSGAQLNYAGHLEQLLFGRLADYPEWRDAVLAALPAAQRDVVKNGLDAGKQLRML